MPQSSSQQVIMDATMLKIKALADLEANMERLEKIIVQKDLVIEGLKR